MSLREDPGLRETAEAAAEEAVAVAAEDGDDGGANDPHELEHWRTEGGELDEGRVLEMPGVEEELQQPLCLGATFLGQEAALPVALDGPSAREQDGLGANRNGRGLGVGSLAGLDRLAHSLDARAEPLRLGLATASVGAEEQLQMILDTGNLVPYPTLTIGILALENRSRLVRKRLEAGDLGVLTEVGDDVLKRTFRWILS